MAGPAERLPSAAGRLPWWAAASGWPARLWRAAAFGRPSSSGLWGASAAGRAAARVRTASRPRRAAATAWSAWTRAAAARRTSWRAAAAAAGLSWRAAAGWTGWTAAAGLSAPGLRPLGVRLSIDYKTPWITRRA